MKQTGFSTRTRMVLLLAAGICLGLHGRGWGQVPSSATFNIPQGAVNYQATMKTAAGSNYVDGLYDVEFRVYDQASSGTCVWGAGYKVYAQNGAFGIMLGQTGGTNLSGTTYNASELWKALWYDESAPKNNLYLGIRVLQNELNQALSSPVEAVPRQQLLATPFACRAEQAYYARASQGDFSVTKQLTTSNLTVNGTATFSKNVTFSTNVSVSGPATFSGAVTVPSINVSGAAAVGGALTVGGTATLSNNVTMQKPATFNDTATFAKTATFNSNIVVSAASTFQSAATFVSGATLQKSVTIQAPVSVSSQITCSADIIMNGVSVVAGAGRNTSFANDDFSAYIRAYDTGSIALSATGGNFSVSATNVSLTLPAGKKGGVMVNSNYPFVLRSYRQVMTSMIQLINTGYSTNNWVAMVVGHDSGLGDTRESGSNPQTAAMVYKSGGNWWVKYQVPVEGAFPTITVHVLFIRPELCSDERTEYAL